MTRTADHERRNLGSKKGRQRMWAKESKKGGLREEEEKKEQSKIAGL